MAQSQPPLNLAFVCFGVIKARLTIQQTERVASIKEKVAPFVGLGPTQFHLSARNVTLGDNDILWGLTNADVILVQPLVPSPQPIKTSDPSSAKVSGVLVSGSGGVGNNAFTVTTYDKSGAVTAIPTDVIQAWARGQTTQIALSPASNGTTGGSFKATRSGSHTVVITLNNTEIKGSPFTVAVVPTLSPRRLPTTPADSPPLSLPNPFHQGGPSHERSAPPFLPPRQQPSPTQQNTPPPLSQQQTAPPPLPQHQNALPPLPLQQNIPTLPQQQPASPSLSQQQNTLPQTSQSRQPQNHSLTIPMPQPETQTHTQPQNKTQQFLPLSQPTSQPLPTQPQTSPYQSQPRQPQNHSLKIPLPQPPEPEVHAQIQPQKDVPLFLPSFDSVPNSNGTFIPLRPPRSTSVKPAATTYHTGPPQTALPKVPNTSPRLQSQPLPHHSIPTQSQSLAHSASLPTVAASHIVLPTMNSWDLSQLVHLQSYIRMWRVSSTMPDRRKMSFAAKEILSSEYDYLKNLTLVETIFYEPLLKIISNTGIDERKLAIMFSNVGKIKTVSTDLYQLLMECLGFAFNVGQVGISFCKMSTSLKAAYVDYINNYDLACETLADAMKNSPAFANLVTGSQQMLRGLTIQALLIMPVQRLPKYELLIRELLTHTPKSEPAWENLTEAFGKVREVVEYVNEKKRKYETQLAIQNIRETVTGMPESFFKQQDRIHLDTTQIRAKTKGDKLKLQQFTLFNDLLLICKSKQASKYMDQLLLKSSRVEYVRSTYTMRISCSSVTWTLVFENPSTFLVWIGHLTKDAAAATEKKD